MKDSRGINVAINCVAFASGGALAYLKNLIPRLYNKLKLDPQVANVYVIIKSAQVDYLEHTIAESDLVVFPDLGGLKRFIKERKMLPEILARHNVDLVFTPYQITPPTDGVINVVMLRNMEPFLCSEYKYSFLQNCRNLYLRWQTKKTLARSDGVIAVSDFVAGYLRQELGIPSSVISTVYHGRDTSLAAPLESEQKNHIRTKYKLGDRFIFTCGSILPYRRIEDILWCFDRFIASKYPGMELVVAGKGDDKKYAAMINDLLSQLDNRHRIKWLGPTSYDDVKGLYKLSELFVTATEIEACPNIAIESLTAGCKVVSGDFAPLREIYGDSATYFVRRNIGSMADAIVSTLERPTLESEKKRQSNLMKYDWDLCAENTIRVLLGHASKVSENGLHSATTTI